MDVQGDIMLDKLKIGVPKVLGNIVEVARDQVVQHRHFMPLGQETISEVRTEETGSAGNEDTHRVYFGV